MKQRKTALCAILAILMSMIGNGLPLAAAKTLNTTIIFAEGQITSDSEDVVINGTTAAITSSGSYMITGACNQGQLVINTSGKVTLTLENLTLTSADCPAIDIQAAKEVTLFLPKGSDSTLTDASQYTNAPDGQDAAIFSKADLTISGEGSLTVNGQYNDGIASRDTLLIEGGCITINARSHGVKGKDYLIIRGGTINVTAGGDGLKATNSDQAALGYVQIDAGTLFITAQDDGISAVSLVTVNGGDITIDTGNNGMKSEGALTIAAGRISIITDDDGFVSQTKSISPDADVIVEER
ncbi:MAG: carbohydrate-binding domain-containing protein [Oscillospiraceae bacterium]|nr:carbohydrate-binding domain-containing protein [Oscillospiraceae bacterium]